jgi:hypothetical protein
LRTEARYRIRGAGLLSSSSNSSHLAPVWNAVRLLGVLCLAATRLHKLGRRVVEECDIGTTGQPLILSAPQRSRKTTILYKDSVLYGLVLGEEANAFFTTAESFAQLQDSEPSSQRGDLARSTGRFGGKGGGAELVILHAVGDVTS